MGRPKLKPSGVRSRAAAVRFREEEWDGLKQLAENLGETPSRIIRRLVREALTGGPDYFDDGVIDLRNMHRELNAIGRNLNQLTRAVNQGQGIRDQGMVLADIGQGIRDQGMVLAKLLQPTP